MTYDNGPICPHCGGQTHYYDKAKKFMLLRLFSEDYLSRLFLHLTIFSERGTLHWLQLTQQSTKASKNIVEESLKDSEKNWIKSSVITSKLRKWKRLLPTKKVTKRL